jgi:hypothetical protein
VKLLIFRNVIFSCSVTVGILPLSSMELYTALSRVSVIFYSLLRMLEATVSSCDCSRVELLDQIRHFRVGRS